MQIEVIIGLRAAVSENLLLPLSSDRVSIVLELEASNLNDFAVPGRRQLDVRESSRSN
ncbi:MAG: hypothetical protein M3Y27_02810 [Acidobacteriota bacterium]|nr:hypothetical protein [Acidobacteriota bacterium]